MKASRKNIQTKTTNRKINRIYCEIIYINSRNWLKWLLYRQESVVGVVSRNIIFVDVRVLISLVSERDLLTADIIFLRLLKSSIHNFFLENGKTSVSLLFWAVFICLTFIYFRWLYVSLMEFHIYMINRKIFECLMKVYIVYLGFISSVFFRMCVCLTTQIPIRYTFYVFLTVFNMLCYHSNQFT